MMVMMMAIIMMMMMMALMMMMMISMFQRKSGHKLKDETVAAQIRASMSSAKTLEMKQELKKSLEK